MDSLVWNILTLSCPAKIRISKYSSYVRILLSQDRMKNWEDISGFPRDLKVSVGNKGNINANSVEMP